MVLENPMLAVKKPKVIRGEVQFLKVDDMAQLFTKAWEHDRELCGYLALGAFAGMRSSAILRLAADDVKAEQRAINMPAAKTKGGRRHFVQGYPPNLWAWLKACPPVAMGQRAWDDRRAAVALRASVELPHNALRHSFCTHHVALHGDAGKTATLLTHRGVQMLWEHYKGNTTKADARRYFEILPPV
jgi:integrase